MPRSLLLLSSLVSLAGWFPRAAVVRPPSRRVGKNELDETRRLCLGIVPSENLPRLRLLSSCVVAVVRVGRLRAVSREKVSSAAFPAAPLLLLLGVEVSRPVGHGPWAWDWTTSSSGSSHFDARRARALASRKSVATHAHRGLYTV
mmetsp:Transcript_14927/g.59861  ORF Transcript_14927/g.59861 Transcript_14927/m.59861 type:complete len:146 (-) Transcript_14927:52-489(-)